MRTLMGWFRGCSEPRSAIPTSSQWHPEGPKEGGRVVNPWFSARTAAFFLIRLLRHQGNSSGDEDRPASDRVRGDIRAMVLEVFVVIHPQFRESALPDLARVAGFALEAKRKAPFDELHRFFDGHVAEDRQQQMQMIGHDDEVVEVKSFCRDARAQHIDQQGRVAVGLQERCARVGFCCDKRRRCARASRCFRARRCEWVLPWGGGIQLFCEDWDPREPGFSWGAVTKERRRG